MKKLLCLFLVLWSASASATDSLLTSSDLGTGQYLGAFKVSQSHHGCGTGECNFQYGGTALSFWQDPTNGPSLFMAGIHTVDYIAQIQIPALVNGWNSGNSTYDTSLLNTASMLQDFAEVTWGNKANIAVGGSSIGGSQINHIGILPYSNKLLITDSAYQGSGSAVLSHFWSNTNLATNNFAGMYGLSLTPSGYNNEVGAWVNGYMAVIPAAYQSQLGGKVITGNASGPDNLAGAGYQSMGPALAVMSDPDNLGASPLSSSWILGYPTAHRTLGEWGNGSNAYVSDVTNYMAAIFPPNSRSVLFLGSYGTNDSTGGKYCYGLATSTAAEQCYASGTANPNWSCPGGYGCNQCASNNSCGGSTNTDVNWSCCYDLNHTGGAGQHGYPYHLRVTAYDVGNLDGSNSTGNTVADLQWSSGTKYNTLTAVKLGIRNPWDIYPYSSWNLPEHFGRVNDGRLYGASLDTATGKLYVSVGLADGGNVWPVVEVYQLGSGSSPPPTTTLTTINGKSVNGSAVAVPVQ